MNQADTTLRDKIIKCLSQERVWRNCEYISQKCGANSVDVGRILKILREREKIVKTDTSKYDRPIQFLYKLAKNANPYPAPPAITKPQREVTPEILVAASLYLQTLVTRGGRGTQTDIANALGVRQRYIAEIISRTTTASGASVAPAWVVLRVYDMAMETSNAQ